MRNFFDVAMKYLIQNEGSAFTNNPLDSGGPTKFGITKVSYESFVGHLVEVSVIETLTIETAREFYKLKFWDKLSCERLTNLSIALCLFDSAVLYGEGTAAIIAQKTLSRLGASIKFDGLIGDITVTLLNRSNPDDFLATFHSLLLERIEAVIFKNPKNEKFRDGWTARANKVLELNKLEEV